MYAACRVSRHRHANRGWSPLGLSFGGRVQLHDSVGRREPECGATMSLREGLVRLADPVAQFKNSAKPVISR
jgi:hypothetical protein